MYGYQRELLGVSDSGKGGTPVLRRDWTRRKSQIGDRKNNKTMRRAEEGEECRRAAVLQDTFSCSLRFSVGTVVGPKMSTPMSIAVADFGIFCTG